MPGVSKIQDGYNPATWMLEVTTPAQEIMLGVDFADLYKKSDLYRRNKALISELSVPRPGTNDLHFDNQYSQPFWTQCMACLWKQHWSYWRNPAYTAVRYLFTIFIALTIGTMFWDLGTKVGMSQDLFNAMGSMYAPVFFIGFQNASSVLPVVDVERTVFYRERAAGMYSAIPYAFGQVFIELPYIFVQAITYGVIVYAMIGFEWTASKFFWYMFFMYFTLLYFTFYGMMCVAVTPNQNVALIVSIFFYSLWNLFSGFIVPRPLMPIWWRWYYWACPVAWTLYGLLTSQFGELQNKLSDSSETVEQFLRRYFGFKHDFLGVVAVMTAIWKDRSLESRSLMDPISVSGRCRLRLSVPERSSLTLDRSEVGVHEGGGLEAQRSAGSRADPVDFVEKCGIQHRQGENHVRSVEDTIKYVRKAICDEQDSPVESCILDSGASFHSSPSKELFQNFKFGNFKKVYLVDNKPLVIERKGDVCIKTPAGNQWTLEDVRYIPGFKKNLISVGQLDSTGYATEFGKGSWKIVKGDMVVARGTKFGTLYTTAGCINMDVVAEGASGSCLWHNRLGHMSAKRMKMLVAKRALEGMKFVDMGLCESYVMGKQKRVSFTKTARAPKKVRLGNGPYRCLGTISFFITWRIQILCHLH
ncbi:hypothetical protein BC332_16881 [Capsicum chinense]|nr:hypothetical protein BC332_16881 [Capsicum chinense]